jgi:hypothetical protein
MDSHFSHQHLSLVAPLDIIPPSPRHPRGPWRDAMLTGVLFIVVGALLMMVGVCFLSEWLGGSSKVFDHRGKGETSQAEWMIIYVRFFSLVLAPIFFGAIAILLGVSRLT